MKPWQGSLIAVLLAPAIAQAWDPYPSVSNPPPQERAWHAPAPSAFGSAAPFHHATPAVAPATVAPASVAAPAPIAPIAYAPAPAASPVAMAPAPVAAGGFIAPAPVFAPAAAPIQYAAAPVAPAAPVYVPSAPAVNGTPYTATPASSIYYAPATASAYPADAAYAPHTPPHASRALAGAPEWRIGIEGFYDTYEEPDVMETESIYGSLTGSVDYIAPNRWYYGADARFSYGEADYESNGSGTLDGIPEQEYELRGKIGYSMMENGRGWLPYTGLAMRYYRMDLRDETTSTGAQGYDRNIFQAYVPFGMQFAATTGVWDVRSFLEADLLLWGNVSSRLGTIPGYENADNRQKFASGGGLRGEIMFGQDMAGGGGYEFGPFFRYWKVDDSETETQPAGTFLEPENERFQVGAAARYRF